MAGCSMQRIVLLVLMWLPMVAWAQIAGLPSRQALDSLVNPSLSDIAHGAIVANPKHKELGSINAEERVLIRYMLCNTTADNLDITELRSSCSCLKITTAPQSIAPHDTCYITAEFNTEGRRGEFRQTIWVYTSLDTLRPTERLTMRGVVENDDEWLHLPKQMGMMRMSRKEVTIDSNGEQRIVVANTSKTPIRLRGVATLEGITFRCYPEVIEADTEANIMIGYRGSVRDITTMIVVEGVECRPSERVIKVTIKR